MATRRSKRSLKDRPKWRQDKALKTRRRKAKAAAAHKRGKNRAKKRARARTARPRR